MIEWNEQNGIKVFRLSSELFPHKTNPLVPSYTFDFAVDLLKQAGKLAKSYNQDLHFIPVSIMLLEHQTKSFSKNNRRIILSCRCS